MVTHSHVFSIISILIDIQNLEALWDHVRAEVLVMSSPMVDV